MENNDIILQALTTLKKDEYHFMISDMSLFELLDSINLDSPNVKLQYITLLQILYDYNVTPIIKDIIPDFSKQYVEWFRTPHPIIELKSQIFESFSFSLSSVLTDLSKAMMLFLANKLTSDYSSEFYGIIISAINEDINDHFKKVIKSSYIEKRFSLRKRLPLEFRDLIIRELTYYQLLSIKDTFNKQEFESEYNKQNTKYNGLSFKDICSKYLTESDMLFDESNIKDNSDETFLISYIKDILCYNAKFDINDITDYINFKYAYSYCNYYFTTDKKSLNKLNRYFSDTKVKEYLLKTKNFINKYSA